MKTTQLGVVLAALGLVLACHKDKQAEGPMERAGEGVDTAADKTAEGVETGAEKTKEGVKTGAQKTQEGVSKAASATGRAFEKVGEKLGGDGEASGAPGPPAERK